MPEKNMFGLQTFAFVDLAEPGDFHLALRPVDSTELYVDFEPLNLEDVMQALQGRLPGNLVSEKALGVGVLRSENGAIARGFTNCKVEIHTVIIGEEYFEIKHGT